mgnify:CR=1 FL=1
MNKWITPLVVIIWLSSQSNFSYGATSLGKQSCGSWIKTKDKEMDKAYLIGYLNGAIEMGLFFQVFNSSKGIDGNALEIWIDNYCKENPLEILDKAANSLLFNELVVLKKGPK